MRSTSTISAIANTSVDRILFPPLRMLYLIASFKSDSGHSSGKFFSSSDSISVCFFESHSWKLFIRRLELIECVI